MTLEEVLREPEYIPHIRRWLFEQLAAGQIAPERAVAAARRIGVELEADSYAVALFDLPPGTGEGFFSDPAAAARSALMAYFLKYSEYMPVQAAPEMGAVLIKGEGGRMTELTERCVRTVEQAYDRWGIAGWHLAVSDPVSRLEELPACYREAVRLWALGLAMPGQRVLRPGTAERPETPAGAEALDRIDPARADPAALLAFLEEGRPEDAAVFSARYLAELEPAMGFVPFRDYVLLSARFAAGRYVQALGVNPERFTERLSPWQAMGGDPASALREILSAALALREEVSGGRQGGTLEAARNYIAQNIADPELSLGRTAAHAGVTASYLSALFRKELDRTFTQYVTDRRMELARQLLRTTDRRSGQIARACGFRDSHYFNALFRRTQGCTPGQFRAGWSGRQE